MSIRAYLRDYWRRPKVRPWALAVPIGVLLICLPLLRPLRHPAGISDDEAMTLATVQSLVERQTTAIPSAAIAPQRVIRAGGKLYSDQPPMLALLLSGPAWVMHRMGYNLNDNASFVAYVLTVLGVTMPVAMAAGLVYRMGRLFELKRSLRTALSAVVVVGSGLLSYGVVLNPHAPAAVLIMAACACLIHVISSWKTHLAVGWCTLAGASSALAATLDPPAMIMVLLLLLVIAAMRLSIITRIFGMLLFVLGALVPLSVNATWTEARKPTTSLPTSLLPGADTPGATGLGLTSGSTLDLDQDDAPPSGLFTSSARYLRWTFTGLLGSHGLFSHFPVLLIGIAGIGAVMHRHWPMSVKSLAAASAAGAVAVLIVHAIRLADWRNAMFASRYFLVAMPMLLFWSGAWLRSSHSRTSWIVAGILLAFSSVVGLIGLSDPYPRKGFNGYTPVESVQKILKRQSTESSRDMFANR